MSRRRRQRNNFGPPLQEVVWPKKIEKFFEDEKQIVVNALRPCEMCWVIWAASRTMRKEQVGMARWWAYPKDLNTGERQDYLGHMAFCPQCMEEYGHKDGAKKVFVRQS